MVRETVMGPTPESRGDISESCPFETWLRALVRLRLLVIGANF